MARALAQSTVAPSWEHAGVIYSPADPDDDAELCAFLRDNPMPGWVSLSYEREPSFFLADTIEGDWTRTVVAREAGSGRLVGMFSGARYDAYLNGRIGRLGYLGQLRVAKTYRGRLRHLRAGFEACRQLLHDSRETPCYLTSILAENHAARRVLTAGIDGLPTYQEVAPFSTLVLPSRSLGRRPRAARCTVEFGSAETLPDIVQCLQRNGMRFQFAPHWTEATLRSPRCRGLVPSDFVVARVGGEVAGCLALWDQRDCKQYVVRNLDPRLTRYRAAVNVLGPLVGLPRIPQVGETLRQVYFSHVAVDDDDPEIFLALVYAGRQAAARRGFDSALLGIAEQHPCMPRLKRAHRCLVYRSLLYLVYWPDGSSAAQVIDGRIPAPELAML